MTDYLIYTGNFYPHKNLEVLIKAADKLKINTYLVGKKSVFTTRLPQSEYVQFKHNLSDSQVVKLYKKAIAFVMPSKLEGFGLPGLEAMACGCPVIAAKASCLPEIYGDAALYFDPNDPSDLVAKSQLLQTDTQLRQSFIKLGLVQAKKYSWAAMASQTWQIYQNALR